MKYLAVLVSCFFFLSSKSADTLYVEDFKDERYLRFLDSMKAYEVSFSVAKNIADSVKSIIGSNALDDFFLGRFTSNGETSSGEYFYSFNTDIKVELGHVNSAYRGMKNEAKFPWKYLETQYKRLDALKILPSGVMTGAELPNVYIYLKPTTTVIYRKVRRYTVVDPSIKFFMKDNGKTKTAYIRKFYYIQIGNEHERIDSIEKLDPIKFQHISF